VEDQNNLLKGSNRYENERKRKLHEMEESASSSDEKFS
jgi:hypothetical protein